MKHFKSTNLFFVLSLVFTLSGCGSSNSTSTADLVTPLITQSTEDLPEYAPTPSPELTEAPLATATATAIVTTIPDKEVRFKNPEMYDLFRTALGKKRKDPIMLSELSSIKTLIFNHEASAKKYCITDTFSSFTDKGFSGDGFSIEWNNQSFNDFSDLGNLTNLENIFILDSWGMSQARVPIARADILKQLDTLSNAQNIKTIYIRGTRSSKDTMVFPALKNLHPKSLTIKKCNLSDIKNISVLADNLEYLDLSKNNISDIAPITKLTKLKSVDLSHNRITSINGLDKLVSLEKLLLNRSGTEGSKYSSNTEINRFDNSINDTLVNMKNLKMLSLSGHCTSKMTTLKGIKGCDSLKYLIFDFAISKENENEMYEALYNRNLTYLSVVHPLDPLELDNIPMLKMNGTFNKPVILSGENEQRWYDSDFDAFFTEISKNEGRYEDYLMKVDR
ncbi:leucine-rich repeat domain-containing protein [Acetivibrio cellulolyticus]|uniref:leucine-rich repeat domain-containing protein n=1 Tax=Acetivibrio cellulolyticus TaxID=35830 RepID=UPI0001E2BA4F|nr:leucine-rich repeat domain-containing protein [Acetivibrio cellulolyticus]